MSDAEFSVWLENFKEVIDDNLAALNLTAANLTELQNLKIDLDGALAAKQSAEELKKAKTSDLREKRKAAVEKVSFYNKTLKANKAISNSLIEQLGLNFGVSNTSNKMPVEPTELVAEGFSNGNNQLKWKKNGNKVNTHYVVEARLETEPKFSYAGGTTKTKFVHKNQKPGARMFYRVKAQRHDEESTYSNEAVVF
jgi:hypothetical protein